MLRVEKLARIVSELVVAMIAGSACYKSHSTISPSNEISWNCACACVYELLLRRRWLNDGGDGNTGGSCYHRVCAPGISSQIVEDFPAKMEGLAGEKNIEDNPPLPFDTLLLPVANRLNWSYRENIKILR
ncbi:hypothetical protein Fot_19402 [Forsythia ovata]|uniref:Uncharacterized protein n=1 Tax=Forsythia ovata TaxID=205694 RepID=A0ABD1VL96_9LAMI